MIIAFAGKLRKIIYFILPIRMKITYCQQPFISEYFPVAEHKMGTSSRIPGKSIHWKINSNTIFHQHGNHLIINHIIITVIHTTPIRSRFQFFQNRFIFISALRNVKMTKPAFLPIIKFQGRIRALFFHKTPICTAQSTTRRSIFRPEPFQGTVGTDLQTLLSGQPYQ